MGPISKPRSARFRQARGFTLERLVGLRIGIGMALAPYRRWLFNPRDQQPPLASGIESEGHAQVAA